MRELKTSDFINKKIVDCKCALNYLKLIFDDETSIEIEVEYCGHNIHGILTENK